MNALIRNGKHTAYQKGHVIDYIQNLPVDEKREYEISIKPYKKNKSLEQLGYYFSTVVRVCQDWQGLNNLEAHEFLKLNCTTPQFFDACGERYEYRPSIKNMKVKPMGDYIDTCVKFLGSEGQYVPPPIYKQG